VSRPPQYVYILTDGEYHKIGTSTNPVARMRSLQVANARVLSLVWVGRGAEGAEHALHDDYDQHHVLGEWFRLPKGVLLEIENRRGNLLKTDWEELDDGSTVRVPALAKIADGVLFGEWLGGVPALGQSAEDA